MIEQRAARQMVVVVAVGVEQQHSVFLPAAKQLGDDDGVLLLERDLWIAP